MSSLNSHRLNRPSQFTDLATKGKKVVAGSLVCKHLPSPDGAIRLAFVVRKKCGNAVFRNRVRRILRHQLFASFDYASEPRWAMLQFHGKESEFSAERLHADASELLCKLGWVAR